jgi:hypothetical protein
MVHKMVTRLLALRIGTAKTRCPLVRKKGRDEPKFLMSVHPASITKSSLELWRLEGADNVGTFLRKEYIRILLQV